MPLSPKSSAIFSIHVAVILFGFAGLFGKFLALPPTAIVLGRTVFAALTLMLVALGMRQKLAIRSLRDGMAFVVIGVILAIHWSTFFQSIQISTVAIGLLTFSSFPVFITFMEPYFFNEKIHLFDVATAAAVFIGLVLVVPSYDFRNHITQGVLWGTISGFTFAVLSLMNRKYVKAYGALAVSFYQNLFAALTLLPMAFLAAGSLPLTARDGWLLLLLGVLCTALAHALFIKGLTHVKAQLASIIASLEPVYGIILAMLLIHEVPSVRTLIGGGIIIATNLIAAYKVRSEPHAVGELK
jgi:drug/metabolite transporter (DMT)-like permease